MLTRRAALAALPALAAMSIQNPSCASAPLSVFELRNYKTTPGRRDDLIAMFEAYFLDAYTRAGTTILGTFRDADRPDRWFWIRAFPDVASRPERLKGFYGSQDWLSRADACNATIADVSDALLMQVAAQPGIRLPETPSATAIAPTGTDAQIEVLFYAVRPEELEIASNVLTARAVPVLASMDQSPVLILKPQHLGGVLNRQPLRDDPVLAVFIRHGSAIAFDAAGKARRDASLWRDVEAQLRDHLIAPPERRRLLPTSRSWLR